MIICLLYFAFRSQNYAKQTRNLLLRWRLSASPLFQQEHETFHPRHALLLKRNQEPELHLVWLLNRGSRYQFSIISIILSKYIIIWSWVTMENKQHSKNNYAHCVSKVLKLESHSVLLIFGQFCMNFLSTGPHGSQ